VYRVQMGFSVLLDGRVWSTPYRLPHVHTVLEHTAGDSTHLYIHQMLVEGCFNIIDHNQKNAGADLKGAQLNMTVNKNGDLCVDNQTLNTMIYANRKEISEKNLDVATRYEASLDAMGCKK
jgi:hypothetical protein